MAKHNPIRTDISSLFFKPVFDIHQNSGSQYRCTSISDPHFATLGVLRCISHAKTGHEFLQHHADQGVADIGASHFFKALKSRRRASNLASINSLLRPVMAAALADPFAGFEELHDFEIFAADGHYHHAACFDPKPSKPKEHAVASGHFFRIDLRNHHLSHLDTARPKDGKKKDHDINVIKRADADFLRDHAPAGRKVIYAWDKACIDYHLWHRLKHNHGIYFVTREKENSAAEVCSPDLLNHAHPRNAGIISDHHVGTSNGVMLRRIVYTDPRYGVTHTYLTNGFNLPARLIVLIHKLRWDIEKVFDQLKNKLEERKSWASGATAKSNHAVFECLAHNLTLLFERHIMETEGMRDEAEEKKQAGRTRHRKNREGVRLIKSAGDFIRNAIDRATQRTLRFIRWLRSFLYQQVPWSRARARLAEVWGSAT